MKSNQVFVYVGDGEGVPGLPHQLTAAEAEAIGVKELLEAAIKNGNYAPLEKGGKNEPKESEVSDGSRW